MASCGILGPRAVFFTIATCASHAFQLKRWEEEEVKPVTPNLTVTGCVDSSWNGYYRDKAGSGKQWERDVTHIIYKTDKWRLANDRLSVYALETSVPSAAHPLAASLEHGCSILISNDTCENNKNYLHVEEDLAQHSEVPSQFHCAELCNSTAGCKVYVFNKYGACYLKAGLTSVEDDDLSYETVSCNTSEREADDKNVLPTYTCEKNKNYVSEKADLAALNSVRTQVECRTHCFTTDGCSVYVFNKYGACYLKTSLSSVEDDDAEHETVSCRKVDLQTPELTDILWKIDKRQESETKQIGNYTCETNKNYVGNETDLFFHDGVKSEEHCAWLCGFQIGCKVFVFNKDGECYLKSGLAFVEDSDPVYETLSCRMADLQIGEYACESNKNYMSDEEDLASLSRVKSQGACADHCNDITGCAVYVFNKYGACYLKTRWTSVEDDDPAHETVSCRWAQRKDTTRNGVMLKNDKRQESEVEQIGNYTCESNKHYISDEPDLFFRGVKSEEHCARLCGHQTGCNVFVFRKNGMCYLKTRWTSVEDDDPARETVSCRWAQRNDATRNGVMRKKDKTLGADTKQGVSYACEQNKNYISDEEDLASFSRVKSRGDCADLCDNTDGCNVYVINKYGVCYLKTSLSSVEDDDPAYDTVSCRNAERNDFMWKKGQGTEIKHIGDYICESNKNYMSDDVDLASISGVKSQGACADHCNNKTGCVVYVFNKYGGCYLKTRWTSVEDDDPAHGTVSCRWAPRKYVARNGVMRKKNTRLGSDTKQGANYTCEQHKNYISDEEDLASFSRVKSRGDCADLCDSTDGCNVYVINKYGVCYLKTSLSSVEEDDPAYDTMSCRNKRLESEIQHILDYTCESNKNYISDENDLASLRGVKSQVHCANLCGNKTGCNVYVFNKDGECYLKTGLTAVEDDDPIHETVSCSKGRKRAMWKKEKRHESAPDQIGDYMCESNKNYISDKKDLASLSGVPSQVHCAELCGSTHGCSVYVFNKDGDCYLKTGWTSVEDDDPIHETVSCSIQISNDTCENNKNYVSDEQDLALHSKVPSQVHCAELCGSTARCNVYVFNKYGACYLKIGLTSVEDDDPIHETVSCRKAGLKDAMWKKDHRQASEVKQVGAYTCESNKNYISDENDLASLRGVKSQVHCANLCGNQTGCNVYVFNKHGECYLKTGLTAVEDDDPIHETVSCRKAERKDATLKKDKNQEVETKQIGDYSCESDKTYISDANDLASFFSVPSQDHCARLCGHKTGCNVFVFNKDGECYLKTGLTSVENDDPVHETVSCSKVERKEASPNKQERHELETDRAETIEIESVVAKSRESERTEAERKVAEGKEVKRDRTRGGQKKGGRKEAERKDAEQRDVMVRGKKKTEWQRSDSKKIDPETQTKNTEASTVNLHTSTNESQNETVCVSLVGYEGEEYVKALIQNFLYFTETSTKLAIHLDRHTSYNGSQPWSWASDRIAITTTRIGVTSFEGSVFYAHLLNTKTMEDTWPGMCKYWVLQGSNMLWVRSGMEAHVREYRFSPLGRQTNPVSCAFDQADHSQTFVAFSDKIISNKKVYGWGQPDGSFFPFSMVRQFERKMTRHLKEMDDNGSGIFKAKCYFESTWLQTYALNWERVPEGPEFEKRQKTMTPLCRSLIRRGGKENDIQMNELRKVMRGQEASEPHETSYNSNFAVKVYHPVTKFIIDLSKDTP